MSVSPPELETDTAARLRVAVARLSRRLRPTPAVRAAGLTPTGISVLQTVNRRGPIRLSELADEEGINPTMLSRVTADLVDAGLLERRSDPGDRRAAWVTATPAARRLTARIRRERTDAVKTALDNLSTDDRQAIERALPAIELLAESLRGERR
jgi:DNA-binding MarR family transcriptional regulator